MRAACKHVFSAAAVALLALLTSCQPKALSMTPEETQRVEAITANMTTRCVGRYLIDMPERFVLNSESSTVIEGVKVAVQPMDKQLFEIKLAAKNAELGRMKFYGKRSELPFVRAITPLPPTSVGILIDRAEGPDTSRLSRKLEILAWRDGYQIAAHIDATDNTFPEDANDSIAKQLGNDTPEKLAHLLKVYERVSGRKDTEIPSTPGLCIPNGFVAGVSREGQDTGAVYHLHEAPDVWFGITSDGTIGAMSTLFQRSSELEQGMARAGVKTLRKVERNIHGQPYEEWLFTNTPYQDDVKGTRFVLHGNESGEKPDQPFLKLALYNGDRIPAPELTMEQKDRLGLNAPLQKATLSDAEALRIWDKVTATLRPRPGAF